MFVSGPVRVSVPATSANLGPGFDALGLALELRDTVTATPADDLLIEVRGEGADDVPRDATHLVVTSMAAAWARMGVEPCPVHLVCDNVIPHGRGLGSSSAAVVAGIWLARVLVEDGEARLPGGEALQLAAELEGHPDNAAPAILGGFVISGLADGHFYAVPSRVDPAFSAVAFIPPTPVATVVARRLLPDQVPHRDAAANSGRTALLVAALAGAPEHLLSATRDWLHQEYRRPAMPDTLVLIDALRADGVPAFVSGAGPTVLALTGGPLPAVDALLARRPDGWRALALDIDRRGVETT